MYFLCYSQINNLAAGAISKCVEIAATVFAACLMIVLMPISLFICFKVVAEYERAVIFRMGRLRFVSKTRFFHFLHHFFHIFCVCGGNEENSRHTISNKMFAHRKKAGPGVFFTLPCVDSYCKVDLRTVSFDVPPQEVLTKDSVTVSVDAVVYYRISDPLKAVIQVSIGEFRVELLNSWKKILLTSDVSILIFAKLPENYHENSKNHIFMK